MGKIRIGILGAGRGIDLAQNFMLIDNCEVVALCEINEKRAKAGLKRLGKELPVFADFDEFLEQDLDAVALANFFHEHTPYAIKCFEKNKRKNSVNVKHYFLIFTLPLTLLVL